MSPRSFASARFPSAFACWLLLLAAIGVAPQTRALPPGREWREAARLSPAGLHGLLATALARDANGRPYAAALATEDSAATPRRGWWGLTWADSGWRSDRAFGGPDAMGLARFASGSGNPRLAWLERNALDPMASPLLLAPERTGARTDTLGFTSDQSSGMDVAESAGHLWLARSQQRDPRTPGFVVRVRHRDPRGRWRELPALGRDEFGCAVSGLPGGRALCVVAGQSGLSWALADGDHWIERGTLVDRAWSAQNPRLSPRRPGGAWLAWTAGEHAWIAAFDGTRWQAPESLACAHSDGHRYWASWCALATTANGEPVLAWTDRRDGGGRDIACIAERSQGRWAAEEVPGSEGTSIPSLAVDGGGDLWVAGVRDRSADAWYVRTHVTVTAESLVVTRRGSEAVVSWRLTSPAPGSRWTVEVARAGGPWIPVARATAGPTPRLRAPFATATAHGATRCRVRRDAIDARDAWSSEPAALLSR